jgi:hypothetical protein
MAMPRTRDRVVCTFGVTIDTLVPTIAFISVDLPALGAPIKATNPARVRDDAESVIALPPTGNHRQKPRCRTLFSLFARPGACLDFGKPVN